MNKQTNKERNRYIIQSDSSNDHSIALLKLPSGQLLQLLQGFPQKAISQSFPWERRVWRCPTEIGMIGTISLAGGASLRTPMRIFHGSKSMACCIFCFQLVKVSFGGSKFHQLVADTNAQSVGPKVFNLPGWFEEHEKKSSSRNQAKSSASKESKKTKRKRKIERKEKERTNWRIMVEGRNEHNAKQHELGGNCSNSSSAYFWERRQLRQPFRVLPTTNWQPTAATNQ